MINTNKHLVPDVREEKQINVSFIPSIVSWLCRCIPIDHFCYSGTSSNSKGASERSSTPHKIKKTHFNDPSFIGTSCKHNEFLLNNRKYQNKKNRSINSIPRSSLPEDVRWDSFVTHSFLCGTNEPQRTSAGRLPMQAFLGELVFRPSPQKVRNSRVLASDQYWENKAYKLKRSIAVMFGS